MLSDFINSIVNSVNAEDGMNSNGEDSTVLDILVGFGDDDNTDDDTSEYYDDDSDDIADDNNFSESKITIFPGFSSTKSLSLREPMAQYAVSGGDERDAETIRSQYLFFNTPLSEAYGPSVYQGVKNIQEQCSYDYKLLCDTDAASFDFLAEIGPSLVSLLYMDTIFQDTFALPCEFDFDMVTNDISRKLRGTTEAIRQSKGQEMIKNVRSMFTLPKGAVKTEPVLRHVHNVLRTERDVKEAKEDKLSLEEQKHIIKTSPHLPVIRGDISMIDSDGNKLSGPNPGKSSINMDVSVIDNKGNRLKGPPVKEFPPAERKLHGFPARHQHEMAYDHRYEDRHEHGRGFEGGYFNGHDNQRRPGPGQGPRPGPRPIPPSDPFFPGAMGYGAEGDSCMMQNVNELSAPCEMAIRDFYQLRENYVSDEENIHHHHPFFFFILLILFIGGCCWRKKFKRKMKNVGEFLEAIEGNKELKGEVFRVTGKDVPKLPCDCPFAKNGQQSGNPCIYILKLIAVFVLIVFVSIFIAVTSLDTTGYLISHFEDGCSPIFALLILTVICSVQVIAFIYAIRLIRNYLHKKNDGAGNSSSERRNPRYYLNRLRAFTVNSFRSNNTSNNYNNSQQLYSPLLVEDPQVVMSSAPEAEMIQVPVVAVGRPHTTVGTVNYI